MTLPRLESDRFRPENGLRIVIQVPDTQAQKIVDAVLRDDPLAYGDYDRVTWRSTPGLQQFRSLGTGRNAAIETVVEVPRVELSFFLVSDNAGGDAGVVRVLRSIYAAHPYEEPVIFIVPCVRTRHIRGMDEDNPNRFWNNAPEAWVPEEHQ